MTAHWKPGKEHRASRILLGGVVGAAAFVVTLVLLLLIGEAVTVANGGLDDAIGYLPGVSLFVVPIFAPAAILLGGWIGAALAAVPSRPAVARRAPYAGALVAIAGTAWIPIVGGSAGLGAIVPTAVVVLAMAGRVFVARTVADYSTTAITPDSPYAGTAVPSYAPAAAAVPGSGPPGIAPPAIVPSESGAPNDDATPAGAEAAAETKRIVVLGAAHGAAAVVAVSGALAAASIIRRLPQGGTIAWGRWLRNVVAVAWPGLLFAGLLAAFGVHVLVQSGRVRLVPPAFAAAGGAFLGWRVLTSSRIVGWNLVALAVGTTTAWLVGRLLYRRLSSGQSTGAWASESVQWLGVAAAFLVSLAFAVPIVVRPALGYVEDRAADSRREQLNDDNWEILGKASLEWSRPFYVNRAHEDLCDRGTADYESNGRFFSDGVNPNEQATRLWDTLRDEGFALESTVVNDGTPESTVIIAGLKEDTFVNARIMVGSRYHQLQFRMMRGSCISNRGDALVAAALAR